MPTKAMLEKQIIELRETIETLNIALDECKRRGDNLVLAEIIDSAPQFPVNYDDHVLAIEQGFKPTYQRFLAKLQELV